MAALLVEIVALLAACNLSHGQTLKKSDATIVIDAAHPGRALSPDMYGIFFEDINHAGDGGLYAELIQNRDFEYNRAPEGMRWIDDSTVVNPNGWKERYRRPDDLHAWSLIQAGEAAASMSLETRQPLNATNAQSMRFEVVRLERGRAAVANEGYWGVPVMKGGTYRLSFYARKDDRSAGTLTATLEGSSGQAYASCEITGLSGAWGRFDATLTCGVDDPHARLVLAAGSVGTIWLDVVSLFPQETWKNRPNGLRVDLARMLADMRPSFLRFPGGCVVEGATLENRIQWKRTIGGVETRPGHWNLWGYRATDGIGFHEFLQLCEDLDAEAMYVVNVGMSCQGRGGMVAAREQLGDYLQETLDALEYAMGPVTSRWGAVRQANGHPEPFEIKYVEIGNENSGPDYHEAYKAIQSGIKRRYPGIVTIANEHLRLTDEDWKRFPGVGLEMVDEHFYQSPAFFYDQSTRYDAYDRPDGAAIYVGEFAVTQGEPGTGNLRAALGEAAFMVGMERNADIVKMASYAPTFVNVHDRRWNPNMIVYDTHRVYGTPSYHAITMFSLNRPDRVVPTAVDVPVDSAVDRWRHLRGGIALSAWNTMAEYRDVRVEKDGAGLFRDGFSGGATTWTQKQDRWEVRDGAFRNAKAVMEAVATAGDSAWTDYTLTLKARKISGDEGFIVYLLRNGGNQVLWNIGGWGNSVDVLMQDRDAARVDLGKRRDFSVVAGRWYDIRIDVKAGRVRCFLDGELKHDEQLRGLLTPSMYATAGVREERGEVILKIVNPFAEPKSCRVELKSAAGVQSEGESLVLTSESPGDENSFEQPEKVAPRTTVLRNLGTTFDYVCSPNSLSIVTLKLKR
jgi:alpha-L-arabinofuranosidase